MRNAFDIEKRLFRTMKRKRELVDIAASSLSRGAGADFSRTAELLAQCVVTFVCDHGARSELSLETMRYPLSLETAHPKCAFEAMIYHVQYGQTYDLKVHDWVDDPSRKADPDDPAVVLYRMYERASDRERMKALRHVRRNAAQIANWPGDCAMAAAILAEWEDRKV